jgi:hypothetical protein
VSPARASPNGELSPAGLIGNTGDAGSVEMSKAVMAALEPRSAMIRRPALSNTELVRPENPEIPPR